MHNGVISPYAPTYFGTHHDALLTVGYFINLPS